MSPGGRYDQPVSDELLRVFVSSASGHLQPYRDVVINAISRLGMHPVYQEIFPAADPPPVEVCGQKVDECDALVLLLAYRYGSRPPGDERCYTEVEYDRAQETDKPVLVFIIEDDHPWPPSEVDTGEDGDRLAALKAKAHEHTKGKFGSTESLRGQVFAALHELERTRRPEANPATSMRAAPDRRLRPPALAAFPHYTGGATQFAGRQRELDELAAWQSGTDHSTHVLHAIGGTGKSALAWEWFSKLEDQDDIAGLFWWSFYDGSASVTSMCQEFLRYSQGLTETDLASLNRNDLLNEIRNELSSDHYVVVLDGVERLCAAYHRIDPTKVVDEEVDDGLLSTNRLTDASAYELFTAILSLRASKVLVTTRVIPDAFLAPGGLIRQGLDVTRLRGLDPADALTMVRDLGIRGSEQALRNYFAQLEHHPLTIGLIAGLVLNCRASPGDFDSWLSSSQRIGPSELHKLPLVARRTHILQASLAGLAAEELAVLEALSVLEEPASWDLVTELNPHRPEPPTPVEPDLVALGPRPEPPWLPEGPLRDSGWAAVREWDGRAAELRQAAAAQSQQQRADWAASPAVVDADNQLDRQLADLEQRSLVWWDRGRNTYDLHPVVRSQVYAGVDDVSRRRANIRVVNHFNSYEAPTQAATLEDLEPILIHFRALVQTGDLRRAGWLYRAKLEVALDRLGANDTIIELLTSANFDYPGITTDLACAYSNIGRNSEALDIHRQELQAELSLTAGRRDGIAIMVDLNNLILEYQNLGNYRAAHEGLDLMRQLVEATGRLSGDVARLKSLEAEQALGLGRYEDARSLLADIQNLPAPPTAQFYWESQRVDQLDLAIGEFEANGTPLPQLSTFAHDSQKTVATFADLLHTFESWECNTACCDLWARDATNREDWRELLVAADAWGARLRAGGCEAIPADAATALADAGLGEDADADVRLATVIAALPRLPEHLRPHITVAHTQLLLGDRTSAQAHLALAYELARREGPDFYDSDSLRRIQRLSNKYLIGELAPTTESAPLGAKTFPLAAEIKSQIDYYLMPDLGDLREWLLPATPLGEVQSELDIPAVGDFDALEDHLVMQHGTPTAPSPFAGKAKGVFEFYVGGVLSAQVNPDLISVYEAMINGDRPALIDQWILTYEPDYLSRPLMSRLRTALAEVDETRLHLETLMVLWLEVHHQSYREIVQTCWERFVRAIYDAVSQAKRDGTSEANPSAE